MPRPSLSNQLDAAIEVLLAQGAEATASAGNAESQRFYKPFTPETSAATRSGASAERLDAMLAIARELQRLPRDAFRMNLANELQRRAAMMSTAKAASEKGHVRPVPEGYRTVALYLIAKGAAEAIRFYTEAFGATEVMRLRMPDGRIGHAEIQMGKSRIMLADEFPEHGNLSPQSIGGSSVDVHFYVEDAGAWASRAIAAGAHALVPVADQDYGERYGRIEDPFGHRWGFSTPLSEQRLRQVRDIFYVATPYLVEADGAKAINFYKEAFGAAELMRLANPDGSIAHAELMAGDSPIMLSSAAPEYGRRDPHSIGGSPVKIHLYVEDVDALAARATAAGAKIVRPIDDQFYGDRSGQLEDPFGHLWIVSTHIEDVAPEEIERRTASYIEKRSEVGAATGRGQMATDSAAIWRREGFTSVTPYLAVRRAAELIEFVKDVFGAAETFRVPGPSGGITHAEVRIGNSMLMVGGSPEMPYPETPAPLHCYVGKVDEAYQRALRAGAVSLHEPSDQDFGERGASVKDPFGNHWYLATPLAGQSIPEGLRSVTPCFHPHSSSQAIDFLKRAFDAEEIARHTDEAGAVRHATVKIGDAMIEMGDAHGPYQPMPSAVYLYVPDVDTIHRRAVEAGATVVRPPADQPYGERMSWVTDPFGVHWYIASSKRAIS